jgi:cytolysin (calcineurin-like family phosphatase)
VREEELSNEYKQKQLKMDHETKKLAMDLRIAMELNNQKLQ